MLKRMSAIAIAIGFSVALSIGASAGMQEFTDFKVDVPTGWTATQDGEMVAIIANDKSAALSITVSATDGMSGKDLADAFYKQLNGSGLKEEGGYYQFTFKSGAVPSKAILKVEDKKFVLFVITGESPAISTIMSSIQDK